MREWIKMWKYSGLGIQKDAQRSRVAG